MHQTICTVDIAGYGSMDRTRPNYVALRAGMYASVQQAFAEAGIPWNECFQQDVGDSILALAPSTVPKGAFAGLLPTALVTALGVHNAVHPPEERIRLRLALHAGEVTRDEYGVAAPAVIHACRLLDAQPLKDALAGSPGVLAMIVSDWFYTDVIRHHGEYAPEDYRRISVDVKETNGVGWIRLPDHELPAEAPAEVAAELSLIERPPIVRQEASVFTVPVLLPASPEFYDAVDALEDIPCMRDEHMRSLVIDQLRYGGTIRYISTRRGHITAILRRAVDFEGGLMELVAAIRGQEPNGSIPLKRLLSVLTGGGL